MVARELRIAIAELRNEALSVEPSFQRWSRAWIPKRVDFEDLEEMLVHPRMRNRRTDPVLLLVLCDQLGEVLLTAAAQSTVLEYKYDGVRQYCSKTRVVTSTNCSPNGAANSRRDCGSLSRGFWESVAFISANSSRTAFRSGELFQVSGQLVVLELPGAAPITSSIHSAGFSSVPQGRDPLDSK